MIKKATHSLLAKRHFWRYASFDELLELYLSNMLRAVAANLFSVFIPIYMFKSGYGLTQICLYFMCYFFVRIFGDVASGFLTARIGPKHAWIFSHLCNIICLICLLGIKQHAWLFWFSAPFNALGTCFQHIPLHVDFSKIKHSEHNGKEQGYFMILDKVGSALGPLLGGFIAAQYGASYTIAASIVFYFGSLIPLLSTPEAVQTRQKIKIKGFPIKAVWRDIVSHSMQGIDTTVTAGMWPLFLVLVVFQGAVYQSVGFASTIAIAVGIFMTYIFGKLIDGNHPLRAFRSFAVIGSLLYIVRLFITNLGGVIGVNVANEAAYTGSVMAYNKGMYSAADELAGYRIVYFTIMETISELFKGAIWGLLAVLTLITSDIAALKICFIVTAVAAMFIMLERYSALRPRTSRRLLQ